MDWRFHENVRDGLSSSSSSSSSSSPVVNFENRISPSILIIIIILAIVFFVSGILHLVVRLLLRPANREPEDADTVTALQGQLQELFHLHDAGVDQSFIDALPVFIYKAIIGVKDPFDCAVCLCEFEADDRLRLLPKCSHAFHLECIDTWLLSHSTCPLCRRSLLPDFSPPASCSPTVLVLDSASESSRGTVSARRDTLPNAGNGSLGDDDFGPSIDETDEKHVEIESKEESGNGMEVVASKGLETKVVPVKLGNFRSVDPGSALSGAVGEGTSSATGDLDQRRCFSMGTYEYVMDENSLLQVPIKPPKKSSIKKHENRGAMSECDFHSRREGFKGFDAASTRTTEFRGDSGNARISSNLHAKESFSASKIWLQPTKNKSMADDSSRRAFSFRLPLRWATSDESKPKRNAASPAATASEFNASVWEMSSSEVDLDVEIGSSNYSMESRVDEAPSFARRTLLWLVGRQNRVGNHL